jgi:hypothetical protein
MIELLLSLILALTGVAREVDPGLTALARQRAAETSTDATFSHSGQPPGTWEVLAWNQGHLDPATVAVLQWQASPAHWAILTNPNLTRIGCGYFRGADGKDCFACLLMPGDEVLLPAEPDPYVQAPSRNPAPQPESLPVTSPAPSSAPALIPDTALAP